MRSSRAEPSDGTATLVPCRATTYVPGGRSPRSSCSSIAGIACDAIRSSCRMEPFSTTTSSPFRPEIAVTLALTPADEVVIARQYKHGIGEITLATRRARRRGRGPRAAAARELREETGYVFQRAHTSRSPDIRSSERSLPRPRLSRPRARRYRSATRRERADRRRADPIRRHRPADPGRIYRGHRQRRAAAPRAP